MYWIEYKLFTVLVHIADPILFGTKAGWFGLVLVWKKMGQKKENRDSTIMQTVCILLSCIPVCVTASTFILPFG